MTMFGAMFAPRPEIVATELVRVCRKDGTIAMANWTPTGFAGRMFELGSRYVPPPAGIPAPVLWGDEQIVRQRFGTSVSRLETRRRLLEFDYPFEPPEVVRLFQDYFGPTTMAFAALGPADQSAYRADLENLFRTNNEGAKGRTLVRSEYLEVIAIRS